MSTIIESLQSLVSANLFSASVMSTGESDVNISKALDGLLPTMLQGLVHSNPSNHSLLNELFSKTTSNSDIVEELVHDINSGNSSATSTFNLGADVVSAIFGNKVSGLSNLLSNFSGIRPSSSVTLLAVGGVIVVSFMNKKIKNEGLTLNGILNWLNEHNAEIGQTMPSTFNDFLFNEIGHPASLSIAGGQVKYPIQEVDEELDGGTKWILPILLIGFLSVAIWYWIKASQGEVKAKEKISTQAAGSIKSAADSVASSLNTVQDSIQQKSDESVDDSVTNNHAN